MRYMIHNAISSNSISYHILCLYHIIQYYIISHCITLYWIVLDMIEEQQLQQQHHHQQQQEEQQQQQQQQQEQQKYLVGRSMWGTLLIFTVGDNCAQTWNSPLNPPWNQDLMMLHFLWPGRLAHLLNIETHQKPMQSHQVKLAVLRLSSCHLETT